LLHAVSARLLASAPPGLQDYGACVM